MKIAILGPLNVSDDSDGPLELKLEPKQQVVLLALAANADRGIPLGELVTAVYGSSATLLYKRSIESLVSRLRRTLKDADPTNGVMLPAARGGFYTADLVTDQIDALRFLRLTERLLNNWTTIGDSERESLARRALDEWRDDPVRVYGGICPVAADLFRRFTSSLAELGSRYINLLLEAQQYDQATRELARLVGLLPTHTAFKQMQDELGAQGVRSVGVAWVPAGSVVGPASATQELCQRLDSSRSLPVDAVTVTAHNLDRIYLVDRVAPDHEVAIDVPLEAPGGSGANTIAALCRLGCTVAAAGIVADDVEGRVLLDDLNSTGVDCSCMFTVPAEAGCRSGHSIIFSDTHGVRSIYVHAGVNESLAQVSHSSPGGLERLQIAIAQSRIVHFTSFTSPAELRLQESFASSLPSHTVLSLNPGALYASLGLDRLDPILSRVNILFLYEQNLRQLVDNSAAPWRETGESGIRADLGRLYAWKSMKGYDQPLVTLVKRFRSAMSGDPAAAYLTIASGRFEVEEILGTQARVGLRNIVPVKDSTGAGDGMAAGLMLGLLGGASLRECADLSFLMATMVSDHVGARAGQPTRDRLRSEWRSYFPGVAEPRCLSIRDASRVGSAT
ncbi:MAG: PfkB family carbohydrate kinase [Actinobacteria bacterium]|nr:PfkB family carbohydrate kinase [Actinomycetota bacterium]